MGEWKTYYRTVPDAATKGKHCTFGYVTQCVFCKQKFGTHTIIKCSATELNTTQKDLKGTILLKLNDDLEQKQSLHKCQAIEDAN